MKVFNYLPSGRLNLFHYDTRRVYGDAKEYAEKYIPRFKKVAENAYIDGMMDAMKLMRDTQTEHGLEGYCQAMDDYCDECKERRAGV